MQFFLRVWNPTFTKTDELNPLGNSWQHRIKEELLRALFQWLSDRKVQCTFNICVNISHLSPSLMSIVQSSLHPEIPRAFHLFLLVQSSWVQMLGDTFVSFFYSYFDCLLGISERGSTSSPSDCRQQGSKGKDLPITEIRWLGAGVVSPRFESGQGGQVYSWSTRAAESSASAVFPSLLRKSCAIYRAAKPYKIWRDLFS